MQNLAFDLISDGQDLLAAGDPDAAIAKFEASISEAPRYSFAYEWKAGVLWTRNEYQGAVDCWLDGSRCQYQSIGKFPILLMLAHGKSPELVDLNVVRDMCRRHIEFPTAGNNMRTLLRYLILDGDAIENSIEELEGMFDDMRRSFQRTAILCLAVLHLLKKDLDEYYQNLRLWHGPELRMRNSPALTGTDLVVGHELKLVDGEGSTA